MASFCEGLYLIYHSQNSIQIPALQGQVLLDPQSFCIKMRILMISRDYSIDLTQATYKPSKSGDLWQATCNLWWVSYKYDKTILWKRHRYTLLAWRMEKVPEICHWYQPFRPVHHWSVPAFSSSWYSTPVASSLSVSLRFFLKRLDALFGSFPFFPRVFEESQSYWYIASRCTITHQSHAGASRPVHVSATGCL